ncbi:MAG: hypothetical protein U9R29_00965 [Thermodesulfobacteriota bacterium]|nr:hypothetical protein [Thermodesulfobacteriota bacterium]
MISRNHNELGLLAKLAAAESLSLYLVGGCLRDQLLHRTGVDFDLVSTGDPTVLARCFAKRVNGHWFCLDAKRGYSRVVTRSTPELQFDFAPFRADTIEGDLTLRDFTINAMAQQLYPDLSSSRLIDPLGGQADLKHCCLRMCGDDVLSADPLRILKGLRHCAVLQLTPDAATQQALTRYAPLMKRVAGERIRSELGQLFASEKPQGALELFFDCGVADALGIVGDKQQAIRSYENVRTRLAQIYADGSNDYCQIFAAPCGDNYTINSLLCFSALLRGCASKPHVIDELLNGLHFERRLANLIFFAVKITTEQLQHFDQMRCSQRGKLLWLQQQNGPLPEAFIVYAALGSAPVDDRLREQTQELWQLCQQYLRNGRIIPLLTSTQVQQHRPQCTGGELGSFFQQLKQAEISGKVHTQRQAESYLTKWRKSN